MKGFVLGLRFSSSPQSLRDYAAQRFSAGLFWYAADEELAHRTTDTETARTTEGRGLHNPKGLQGPPRAARDAASAAQRNLVLSAKLLVRTRECQA